MRDQVEVRQLRCFLAVAEEMNFGRAARRLGMTQPPLSLQIRNLERILGVELFDRSRRAIALTAAGRSLLGEADGLMRHLERVQRRLRAEAEGAQGQIELGTVAWGFMGPLQALLSRLRLSHPGIAVAVAEVGTGELLARVQSGEFDAGLVWADQARAPLAMRPVLAARAILAVPSGHPLARGRGAVPLAALEPESFVLVRRSATPPHRDRVILACTEAGFTPRVGHESASIASQLGIVACGTGIALVPSGARRLPVPGVAFRRLDRVVELGTLSIVWNGDEPASPGLRALIAASEPKGSTGRE
ncbi:LysR substrate-binding domain-containing protein [Roseomonas sp. OT10]|uniref:LysR substrate-binding domain-containing protein n=1 Tax=Roseomonas cutis TaxID=2897332 RepID=UPI001E2F0C54|nr:LysR substrate-binding domain-containing protein [Roseomonas sp. OT10]UFN49644.1 LysR substrate-binding domain-containing protein [Roseomonas sp. OT10]